MLKHWLKAFSQNSYEVAIWLITALLDVVIQKRFRPLPSANPTILVIKVDEIGDYVLFRNYLNAIKKHPQYCKYEVTLAGNEAWKPLAERFDEGIVNEFIWIKPKSFLKNPRYRWLVGQKLRSYRYDVVIYPTYSRGFFIGDQLIKLSKASKKIGFKNYAHSLRSWQEWISDKFYTHLINTNFKNLCFEFDRLQEIFKSLIDNTNLLPKKPSLAVEPGAVFSFAYRSFVTIAPGAGSVKREWPIDNFLTVINQIGNIRPDLQIIVIGGSADKAKGAYLENHSTGVQVHNFAGVTRLDKVPDILKASEVVIANETSIPHLSAAVNTPCICPSNGNHYLRFHPYPERMIVKNEYIYPPDFEPAKAPYFYYYNLSDKPIESVRVADVMSALKPILNTGYES